MRGRVRFAIVVVVAIALVVGAVVVLRRDDDSAKPAAAPAKPPNIIMIMTDDQTVESMRVLPKVKALIAAAGVTFADNVVSFPLCCPSRATYFTGEYAHNNGVHGNQPPFGGYGAFGHQETTFPAALQRAGYDTIHIGKYLNGYGHPPVEVPPGWSDWHGSIDPTTYQYFGFTLLENGARKTYGKKDSDYQTDVYTHIATSVIRDHERSDKPYFLNVAYLAPHAGAEGSESATADGIELHQAVAAPRDSGHYAGEPLPKSAAFDEADVSDKPLRVRTLPRITDKVRAAITKNYDVYLESLLAVDDGVESIMKALEATGQLDHTVVMFTSDNGFFFGEHRIRAGKTRFYEPSIRVPLLVRGPGIPAGATRRALVANIDLAPTILDLAGATPLRTMDGNSLVSLLHEEPNKPEARAILLESGGARHPDLGVRTRRYAYFENSTGEHELYDLRTDPDELDNRHGDPALASVEAALARRLAALEKCAGATCRDG